MTKAEHKKIHEELHQKLDSLVGDMIFQTGMLPSKTTVFDLMEWSYKQTLNPTEN